MVNGSKRFRRGKRRTHAHSAMSHVDNTYNTIMNISNLEHAQSILEANGIVVVDFHRDGSWAVAICEAIGWYAKRPGNEKCYPIREKCILEAAALNDVQKGVRQEFNEDGKEEVVIYLYASEVGTATFHDLSGSVAEAIGDEWFEPWSGIRRQQWAFETLKYPEFRKILVEFSEPDYVLPGTPDEVIVEHNRKFQSAVSRFLSSQVLGGTSGS
jgi:hypothetical protein